MSKLSIDKFIELILKEYQKVFLEIGNHEIEKDGMRYGIPPKSIIVKYHDIFNVHGFKIGKTLSVWRVSCDHIEYIDNRDIEPVTDPKDGMYFHEGIGYFSINENYTEIRLDWFVGPRYGRGFIYKSIDNIEGITEIIQDKLILVS